MKTDETAATSTRRTRAIDRRGKRYGRLVALEPLEARQCGSVVWRCRCDCGNEVDVRGTCLTNGTVTSCGCAKRERLAEQATDHTGKRYGKLVALQPVPERQGGGVLWRCRCDCGNEVLVRGNFLTSGKRQSCGKCLPREKARAMRYINQMLGEGASAELVLARLSPDAYEEMLAEKTRAMQYVSQLLEQGESVDSLLLRMQAPAAKEVR